MELSLSRLATLVCLIWNDREKFIPQSNWFTSIGLSDRMSNISSLPPATCKAPSCGKRRLNSHLFFPGSSLLPYPFPPRRKPELFPLSKRRPVWGCECKIGHGPSWEPPRLKWRRFWTNGQNPAPKWHQYIRWFGTQMHTSIDSTYNACVCMHGLCHHTLIYHIVIHTRNRGEGSVRRITKSHF